MAQGSGGRPQRMRIDKARKFEEKKSCLSKFVLPKDTVIHMYGLPLRLSQDTFVMGDKEAMKMFKDSLGTAKGVSATA